MPSILHYRCGTILAAASANADITVEITEGRCSAYSGRRRPLRLGRAVGRARRSISQRSSPPICSAAAVSRLSPKKNMLQKPTTGADVDFDDWSFVKAEAVVVGKVEQTGRKLLHGEFSAVRCVSPPAVGGLPHSGEPGNDASRSASRGRHDLRESSLASKACSRRRWLLSRPNDGRT